MARIALGVFCLASLILRLATWDIVADGPRESFTKTALIGAGAAIAVWVLARSQVTRGSLIPPLAAVTVLLAGDALHYARRLHPIARGVPITAVASSAFPNEAALHARWEVETSGGGRVAVEDGALILESPARGAAFVRPRLAPVPNVERQWWLPLGLAVMERTDALAWRGAAERTGTYYVIAELRDMLIQVVSFGVHITFPDAGGVLRGHEVRHAVGTDGRLHQWRLRRARGAAELFIDGERIWAQPSRHELSQVRLGETKADPEHGGRLRLEAASFSIALDRAG